MLTCARTLGRCNGVMEALGDATFLQALLEPGHALKVERFNRSRVPRSWGLHERRVDEHYLGLVLHGSAELRVPGFHGLLPAHGAFLVAPGVAHSVRPDPGSPFQFYHLRFRLHGERDELRLRRRALALPAAGALRGLWDACFAAWATRQPLRELRFRALLAALLGELLSRPRGEPGGLSAEQQRRVIAYVAERLPESVTPRDVARELGLALAYCSRRFARSFGQPPRRWLVDERLRHAALLLSESDEPVAAVGERCGFAAPWVFSRQFRRLFGCSPSAYRRRAS